MLTFWCAPPFEQFDDRRAAQIAAAGFNVVGPPCEGPPPDRQHNLAVLDIATRHRLRVFVADDRLARRGHDWQAGVFSAVEDYRRHPALGGYFVEDEPDSTSLGAVADVVTEIASLDPRHPSYVNLLPDYAFPSGASYRDYVDRFLADAHAQWLSYDYYPFLINRDRPTFFANLALMRDRARSHQLPFMLVIQAMPHGPYRDSTESELSWQVFHALAYGARGISYFAYWTPVSGPHARLWKYRDGLIVDGRPTVHYFQAAQINRQAIAFARELAEYRSVGVADSVSEVAAPLPLGPLRAIDGARITVGLFDHGGDLALLLVNRDYQKPATARLRLLPGTRPLEQLSPDQEGWKWKALTSADLAFSPGGAHLLRLR